MIAPSRLMNRNFLLLWQGQLVSQMGTQLFQVIVILWLKEVTGSAALVGLLMVAYTAPAAVLGPIGGALVDRYSRRSVLLAGDLLRGIALIGLGVALAIPPHSMKFVVCALFLYSVMEGAVGAVWQPAGMAVVPDLVPKKDIEGANSFIQSTFGLCTVAAQAVAGILFRVLGTSFLMIADGLTYLYAALMDALIRVPPPPPRTETSKNNLVAIKEDILQGFKYIHGRHGLRLLFYSMAFMQVLLVPVLVLFPFYVDERLHAGTQWYGFLLAASGLGMFLGFGMAGALGKLSATTTSRLILFCGALMGIPLASLAFITQALIAVWAIGCIGTMNGFLIVSLVSMLQRAMPSELRGRAFGLLTMVTQGLTPVAMGLAGVVADITHRNVPVVYFVCGAAATILSLNLAVRRECREFLVDQKLQVVAEAALQGAD